MKLRRATRADIATLVRFDEMAAVGSSHMPYTEKEIEFFTRFYGSTIESETYEPLLVIDEEAHDAVIGAVLLQHQRPTERFVEAMGEPFIMEGSGAHLIPRDEFLRIMENRAGVRTHIKSLSLMPEARGRNVGKTLLAALLAHIAFKGVAYLSLSTAPENAAMQRLAKQATWLKVRTGAEGNALPVKLIGVIEVKNSSV